MKKEEEERRKKQEDEARRQEEALRATRQGEVDTLHEEHRRLKEEEVQYLYCNIGYIYKCITNLV